MAHGAPPAARPNVILMMADDLGWGDTGYNGHPVLKTPALDAMAREGVRFDRFYAAAPVCSPTRGSCLTGRHPFRYGILYANVGHLLPRELKLAEVLQQEGYATGHFGKWHLGTLTTTLSDGNRGGEQGAAHFSPPWQNGFATCFSTEAKVPTWNPMLKPGSDKPYGTRYFSGADQIVTENLSGDDSRVIVDRAAPFIQAAVENKTPFFAVIWFHTPHLPVVAGPEYLARYADQSDEAAHYYGAITAMDEQIGRVRETLKELGVERNTMLWFASDNGPEGQAGRDPGSARNLRGRKRSLFEGGVRVPGLLVWPEKIKTPRRVDAPCCTSDYYPTILAALDLEPAGQPTPIDGVSLLPLLDGRESSRPRPIGFRSDKQLSLVDNRYKLIQTEGKQSPWMLFDLEQDPGETTDLAAQQPERVEQMRAIVEAWSKSLSGAR